MICPSCERETNGVTNNRKELRCEYCYFILPPGGEPLPSKEKPVQRKQARKARAN